MRIITILAVAAMSLVAAPIAYAQTSSPAKPATTSNDAHAIWEKIKGSWNQTKGAIKEQWGKLTDDDLMAIQGRRDQLIGKIQVRYGISQAEAEAQVSGWEHKYKSM